MVDKRVKMVAVENWREGMETKVTNRRYRMKQYPRNV